MKIFSLKKKKVLITGGNSGIGKEIYKGFKKAGDEIGVFYKDYKNISEHKSNAIFKFRKSINNVWYLWIFL